MKMVRTLLAQSVAGVAMIALCAAAQAQSVTKAQQDAIRANCRSDFMRNCSSVTPGGREAFMCLQQNKAKLSAGCKSAIDAVTAASAPKPAAAPAEAKPQPAPTPAASAPAPAATPAPAAAAPAEKSAPAATAAPVAPAPAKPAAKSAPTPKAAAVPAKPVPPAPAAAPATPVAAPPPAATPDTPRRTTLGEAMIIRRFCGNDYRVLCKGTQIGGGRAIKCLADNRPALSPGCKAAMANAGN